MGKRMFGDVFKADFPPTGIDVYNARVKRIRRLVPKKQLLTFNVKNG